MRSWLPREVGGVLWFGNDDGNMVAYTPVYCGNTVQPECYNTPGADALTFSDKNAYWVCNWVSNMVYPRYNMMFASLKTVRDSLEKSYFAAQADVEKKAVSLYSTDKSASLGYLNQYSNDKAQQMLGRWKQLATYLIVKYNDMAVRQERDGHFLRTRGGIAVPLKRISYPETYRGKLINDTGDKYVSGSDK
jgi:dipeptidase